MNDQERIAKLEEVNKELVEALEMCVRYGDLLKELKEPALAALKKVKGETA
jgi:hypothetical protein